MAKVPSLRERYRQEKRRADTLSQIIVGMLTEAEGELEISHQSMTNPMFLGFRLNNDKESRTLTIVPVGERARAEPEIPEEIKQEIEKLELA